MSLASDYAARVAAAKDVMTQSTISVPPAFHCDTCDGNVEQDGACRISPGTGTGEVVLDALDALRLHDWLRATFGA